MPTEFNLCNRPTIDFLRIGNGLDTPENHRILSFYTVSANSSLWYRCFPESPSDISWPGRGSEGVDFLAEYRTLRHIN